MRGVTFSPGGRRGRGPSLFDGESFTFFVGIYRVSVKGITGLINIERG